MQISANGIAIEVEDLGKPTDEPLLLIMGLGMQLTAWHQGLVQQMLDQGFRVIRFDNRDVGLSQNFDGLGVPNLALAALQRLARWPVRSAYSLSDMADDAAGVLTALGLKSAHVCGASMGGMIAQQLALNHPERVRSLTLMMTDSGARGLPRPTLKVSAALLARPADPDALDSLVDHYYRLFRLIGSPAYPGPEAWLRQVCADAVRRSNRPQGFARHLMAIAADTGRAAQLGRIKLPTLVLHGLADPLIPAAAAHDLAARIPGAQLELIEGMGHDLPEPLWPRFVAAIQTVAARAA
jgi:pimeloyl-ACP methyl ester carboxylesterase